MKLQKLDISHRDLPHDSTVYFDHEDRNFVLESKDGRTTQMTALSGSLIMALAMEVVGDDATDRMVTHYLKGRGYRVQKRHLGIL